MLKELNRLRRHLFAGFTQGIVKNAQIKRIKDPSTIKKILICRPNQRLGNLLLITPLLQEVEKFFPNAKIDLIVKGGLAKPLFEKYSSIENIFQLPKKPFKQPLSYLKSYFKAVGTPYDLAINATDNSSSGRIITKRSKSTYKLFGKAEYVYWADKAAHKHIAKKPVLALRDFLVRDRINSMPNLDLRLTVEELINGKEILDSKTAEGEKTICIFTYATGNKMHSKDWWNKLYVELKQNFKDYNIIEILPMENVSQIDFKAPVYYGRDIRELGAVIAASEVFIGSDSGIMHLASSVHVPTLGLFNVTDIDTYFPYNHLSQAINTNEIDHSKLIKILKATLNLKELSTNENRFKNIA